MFRTLLYIVLTYINTHLANQHDNPAYYCFDSTSILVSRQLLKNWIKNDIQCLLRL